VKVIIEQTAGKDYPIKFKGDSNFFRSIKNITRHRLELRKHDTVIIREAEEYWQKLGHIIEECVSRAVGVSSLVDYEKLLVNIKARMDKECL
jgi:hypothetical protein